MLPSLAELAQYKNPKLIQRYNKDFPDNTLPAEEALQEILKYLWLTQKHFQDKQANPQDENLDFPCDVHSEMIQMDDMWHTFLLFTVDYHEFCQRYFGKFIHHVPNMHENVITPEEFEVKFTRYLSYVYDHLGEETVKKWFAELLNQEES
jgi:hypothetical protein